ncbi:hypothetical protein O6H91_04G132300 [Diphasiastrum complanatum]|uniref:Uncharacterized protein n=3 Tax=Diphasiastrum complanatum TaxID=34168 RepID=A0ACC2E2A5_DIPCM|nr:hypothetical protein O6H91_04G132300 [Diphasiastrum complanatum]KAJ7560496.1 hypothetical protein O6H91_04G132300 [Diphasiastrum complanatum]KAJ7560497.1 hypothetical protein O6H91_04G132300 [Diphasiastrum complanatum]
MDIGKTQIVEVQTQTVGASHVTIPFILRCITKICTVANDLTRRKDSTINRRLADLIEIKVPANGKPVKGVASRDVTVDFETGVWVRIFYPCDTKATPSNPDIDFKKLPVVVYYHGGGFVILCPDFFLYDRFCRNLAREKPCVVISVHYRRAPEHRYPVAYDDSFGVLKWLQLEGHNALPSNSDLSRCVLMGDSAGGNIVHHIGCKAAVEDLNPVRICGHVLLQPFFGGEARTPSEIRLVNVPVISVESADWYWKAFLPFGANRDHPTCNVFGPHAADISEVPLPHSLVTIGSFDTLQDWQIKYIEGLEKSGKIVDMLFYEGAIHAFHIFDMQKIAKQVRRDICKFIDAQP